MAHQTVPAVLVHGWRSHPGIWNRLVPELDRAGIPCWNFSHAEMADAPLEAIAAALGEYLGAMRGRTGYSGPVDIVCHSMGTGIARYLLEITSREEPVRQLIGLGPPNNGSALAGIFHDPTTGPEVLRRLAGVFVPAGYKPDADLIVRQFRPDSRTMRDLRRAGIRRDVTYRIILTANLTRSPEFFPSFAGRTWEVAPDGGWRLTYAGDGIVSHADAYLPGAGLDILPADPAELREAPDRYCHLKLPRADDVVREVMAYLGDPGRPSSATCPEPGTVRY